MNIEEKKKRKSFSPCLDNFEKPLGGRGHVFLSLASASSREPGTYQVGTQYLLAEMKPKKSAFRNAVRLFHFLRFGSAGSALPQRAVSSCGSRSCSMAAGF